VQEVEGRRRACKPAEVMRQQVLRVRALDAKGRFVLLDGLLLPEIR
jgi:hypothetical protein